LRTEDTFLLLPSFERLLVAHYSRAPTLPHQPRPSQRIDVDTPDLTNSMSFMSCPR
jgi:hypothetical protein